MFVYNANSYTICSQDIEDILYIDSQFTQEGYNELYFCWSREDYIALICRPNVVLTLAKTFRIIAFCLSSISYDHADILKIIVDKDYRFKGIGKKILSFNLGVLFFKGVREIYLEVSEMNIVAINLYKKFGFSVIGKRKNYYGKVDALLMKKTKEI
ncbi:MAG: GNAT family N-acetyltransferase [bacterium]